MTSSYNNIIIKSSKELKLFTDSINKANVLAIDTEFTRKTTYFSELSLLQVSPQSDTAFIIDYLENPEIVNIVLDLIYNSTAVKVFHAAKNDLEILYNLKGKLPCNIFDTQIAFMALSTLSNISYAALVKILLKQDLNKNETLSDWHKRPLSNNQLQYAALDVILLYKAYFVLYKKLEEQNRIEFITEKLNSLTDLSNYDFNLEKMLERYLNSFSITNNYALLASLLNWRENLAKENNAPRQHLLSDSNIKELVNNPKKITRLLHKNKFLNMNEWQEILNLEKYQFNEYNVKLSQRVNLSKHNLLDISYQLLEFICNSNNINKELICSKPELNKFLHYYNNSENNTEIPQLFYVPWRNTIFTKKLELFLSGKLCLTINNGNVEFR